MRLLLLLLLEFCLPIKADLNRCTVKENGKPANAIIKIFKDTCSGMCNCQSEQYSVANKLSVSLQCSRNFSKPGICNESLSFEVTSEKRDSTTSIEYISRCNEMQECSCTVLGSFIGLLAGLLIAVVTGWISTCVFTSKRVISRNGNQRLQPITQIDPAHCSDYPTHCETSTPLYNTLQESTSLGPEYKTKNENQKNDIIVSSCQQAPPTVSCDHDEVPVETYSRLATYPTRRHDYHTLEQSTFEPTNGEGLGCNERSELTNTVVTDMTMEANPGYDSEQSHLHINNPFYDLTENQSVLSSRHPEYEQVSGNEESSYDVMRRAPKPHPPMTASESHDPKLSEGHMYPIVL